MADKGCVIKFSSNLNKFTESMSQAIDNWLEESAGELEAHIKANSRVDTGQTKGSYKHVVDTVEDVAYVGSNLQNAIWEEYGTGEYALDGNGRKGYWVYVKGSDGSYRSESPRRYYTLEEAKKIMAILRDKGLRAYYTNGKAPSRPIFNAFTELEQKLINRIKKQLKDLE